MPCEPPHAVIDRCIRYGCTDGQMIVATSAGAAGRYFGAHPLGQFKPATVRTDTRHLKSGPEHDTHDHTDLQLDAAATSGDVFLGMK